MTANTLFIAYCLGRSNTFGSNSANCPDEHLVTTNVANTTAPSFTQNCVNEIPGPIWNVSQNGFVGFQQAIFRYNYGPPWTPWWAYTFTGLRYVQTPTNPFVLNYPKAP